MDGWGETALGNPRVDAAPGQTEDFADVRQAQHRSRRQFQTSRRLHRLGPARQAGCVLLRFSSTEADTQSRDLAERVRSLCQQFGDRYTKAVRCEPHGDVNANVGWAPNGRHDASGLAPTADWHGAHNLLSGFTSFLNPRTVTSPGARPRPSRDGRGAGAGRGFRSACSLACVLGAPDSKIRSIRHRCSVPARAHSHPQNGLRPQGMAAIAA